MLSGIVVALIVGCGQHGIGAPSALPSAPADWTDVPQAVGTIAFLFLIHVVMAQSSAIFVFGARPTSEHRRAIRAGRAASEKVSGETRF